MALNKYVSVATLAKRHAKREAIILAYLRDVGGSSSVNAAWNLRDKLNPLMTVTEMAMYLHNLEDQGILMFKEGKYQVK